MVSYKPVYILLVLYISSVFCSELEKIEKTSIDLNTPHTSSSHTPPSNSPPFQNETVTLNFHSSFAEINNNSNLSPQNITLLENLDTSFAEIAELYRNPQILTDSIVVHDTEWIPSEIFTRLEKFSFLDDQYVNPAPKNDETVQPSTTIIEPLYLKRRPIETITLNDQPNKLEPTIHPDPVSFTEISCPNLNTQHNLIIRKLYDIDRTLKLNQHTYPSIKKTKIDKHDQILLKNLKISGGNEQTIYFDIKKGNIMVNFERMGELNLKEFITWLFGQKRLLKIIIPIEGQLKQIININYANLINSTNLKPYTSGTVTE